MYTMRLIDNKGYRFITNRRAHIKMYNVEINLHNYAYKVWVRQGMLLRLSTTSNYLIDSIYNEINRE